MIFMDLTFIFSTEDLSLCWILRIYHSGLEVKLVGQIGLSDAKYLHNKLA